MKDYFLFFTFFALTGCSTSPTPRQTQKIINLKPEFIEFWAQAKGQSFNTQLRVWNEVVEKNHQAFYDSLVWNQKTRKKWKERKHKKLKITFKFYEKNYDKILESFNSFEKVLNNQIAKYKTRFPDAKFDLTIYATLSGDTFNGKAGSTYTEPSQNILAFGVDKMTMINDNPDILFSHELFHIYHTKYLAIDEEKVRTMTFKMTLPLWLEGLATYVSSEFNPNASDGNLLFDNELVKYRKDLPWLKKAYLKVANDKAWDEKNPATHFKWFSLGKDKLRKDLPNRTGYLLGLEVVRILSKKYTLKEMIHWQPKQIHEKVLEGLRATN